MMVNDERLRVLVVDDCHDNADSLATLIAMWGHEAVAAYNGQAGLALAVEQQPDVVLFDIAMPPFDGFELAKSLQTSSNALLIAISGYADTEHQQRAGEVGIKHYFAKPVDLNVLEDLLARQRREKCLC